MWRVIFFTILALIALGCLIWICWRGGWAAGQADLRKKLGIAGQRKIKKNEKLVEEASQIFNELLHPAGLDLDQVSSLSTHHSTRAAKWLAQKGIS